MPHKPMILCCLVILLLACTLTAPAATSIPASPPGLTGAPGFTGAPGVSREPTLQPTQTSLPTAIPSSTRTLQPTNTPVLPPSPRPSATRILTPTRYPTPLSRVSEVAGAQCPFNIPVKVVAPGADPGGFDWQPVILPRGDACISRIKIAPNDDKTWFVGGQTALYITRDEGKTWERPLTGQVSAIEIDPKNPNRVLVGFQVASTLYESTDQGRNWRLLKKFDQNVMSLRVSADAIIAGPHWGSSATPNGVYISVDQGKTWQHSPFGTNQRGLIVWDIGRDPRDGTLYAGTEIYDHPQPYKPPVFRSQDGGKTWQEITGILPWHVIAFQVSPADGTVYALTEGASLYGSANHGDLWTRLGSGPSVSLALDPRRPERLYGGTIASPQHRMEGGIYFSTDSGRNFNLAGLRGVTIGSIAFNNEGTTLFVVGYASGIYRGQISK